MYIVDSVIEAHDNLILYFVLILLKTPQESTKLL